MNRIKIVNGKILTPGKLISNGCIVIENGIIKCISETDVKVEECRIINAKGNYVSPGFIDIHVHGGGGYDFMDGTVEAYLGAANLHAIHGTTAMVPTTLTSTNDELKNTFLVFNQAKKQNEKGAELLGLHLEGPYFSFEQRGAQDPRYIRNPQPDEYKEISRWSDDIVRWSAAPELDGALEFGNYLKSTGILPSIAHSNATFEEVEKAVKYGFTHITHLYSAMSTIKRVNGYRHAGVIESAYYFDELTVEIIADGIHLPPSLLKLIYKIKGPGKTALVTDAMRAAGMRDGESILGSIKDGQKVIIEDGVAKLQDRTAFAGSVATTDRLVRTINKEVGLPLLDTIQMMTSTPAKIIGIDKSKGSIVPGKDADIVIFDEDINIEFTLIKGKVVFIK